MTKQLHGGGDWSNELQIFISTSLEGAQLILSGIKGFSIGLGDVRLYWNLVIAVVTVGYFKACLHIILIFNLIFSFNQKVLDSCFFVLKPNCNTNAKW